MSGGGATGATSGTAALAPSRDAGAVDAAIARLAGLSVIELRRVLSTIPGEDTIKLKITCAEVLARPAAYFPSTRAICEVIAAL